jgi:hypothetical protein
MKKIMEIYADVESEKEKNFIVKKVERVYHTFGGVSIDEDVESFKIRDEVDAVNFMLSIFKNLQLVERKAISEDSGYPLVKVLFKLEN